MIENLIIGYLLGFVLTFMVVMLVTDGEAPDALLLAVVWPLTVTGFVILVVKRAVVRFFELFADFWEDPS